MSAIDLCKKMPRCEGLPNEGCPAKTNNSSAN